MDAHVDKHIREKTNQKLRFRTSVVSNHARERGTSNHARETEKQRNHARKTEKQRNHVRKTEKQSNHARKTEKQSNHASKTENLCSVMGVPFAAKLQRPAALEARILFSVGVQVWLEVHVKSVNSIHSHVCQDACGMCVCIYIYIYALYDGKPPFI